MFFLKELPTQKMLDRYGRKFPHMDTRHMHDALTLMRRASVLIREIETYFARYGFSQTRFLALMIIDREGDDAHVALSDLVKRLDVSKPVVTTAIQSLEKQGFVDVDISDSDKRARFLSITEKGRGVLYDMLPGYFTLINEYMPQITAE